MTKVNISDIFQFLEQQAKSKTYNKELKIISGAYNISSNLSLIKITR